MHCLLLNDMHFVWSEVLTMRADQPINIFLRNPIIILYCVFFIRYLLTLIILLLSIIL